MARIKGAEAKQHGFIAGLFLRTVYALSKRKLGRVVAPLQVTGHHPRILWGYAQMEQSQMGSHNLQAALKDLVSLRVATLIGCPF
ncbi:MAG TPA: hypothetical protein VFA89_13360 [Terriglobales bacterium]|nr:hypothetical protein [Terriglobales bacterium]